MEKEFITITTNEYEALREATAEIQELNKMLAVLTKAGSRHLNTILKDAGIEPDRVARFFLEDLGTNKPLCDDHGTPLMRLVYNAQPGLSPEQAAEQKAAILNKQGE